MDTSSGPSTSITLLARLRHSPTDQKAWDEFVKHYGGRLYSWCRHWNLQDADAQDVAQDVLLKLAGRMRTFDYDPGRSFRGWLRTLAHHAWQDFLEARRRPGAGTGDPCTLAALDTVEARADLARQLEEEFDAELLEEAMARVRLRVQPHTWEAFRLLALEGLSGAEAAARLGLKVATVFVARSKVQKMIQDEVRKLEGPAEEEVRP
jgi:RNA polymerase sigma factor (sigma-70 family)